MRHTEPRTWRKLLLPLLLAAAVTACGDDAGSGNTGLDAGTVDSGDAGADTDVGSDGGTTVPDAEGGSDADDAATDADDAATDASSDTLDTDADSGGGDDVAPDSADAGTGLVDPVRVRVLALTREPIAGAIVRGDTEAITDTEGIATVERSSRALRIRAEGYMTQLRATPSGVDAVEVFLAEAPRTDASGVASRRVDAARGGVVDGPSGAQVVLPPGGIVDSTGNPVTGEISVTLVPFDTTSMGNLVAMPGGFEAINAEGEAGFLSTYGAIEVRLEQDGEELNLAEGVTATLRIPVQRATRVGETIPTWSLDEDTGIWREEGEATVGVIRGCPDQFYAETTVEHFSWWNGDDFAGRHRLEVSYVDASGFPVPADMLVEFTLDNNASGSEPGFSQYGRDVIGNIGAIPAPAESIVCFTVREVVGDDAPEVPFEASACQRAGAPDESSALTLVGSTDWALIRQFYSSGGTRSSVTLNWLVQGTEAGSRVRITNELSGKTQEFSDMLIGQAVFSAFGTTPFRLEHRTPGGRTLKAYVQAGPVTAEVTPVEGAGIVAFGQNADGAGYSFSLDVVDLETGDILVSDRFPLADLAVPGATGFSDFRVYRELGKVVYSRFVAPEGIVAQDGTTPLYAQQVVVRDLATGEETAVPTETSDPGVVRFSMEGDMNAEGEVVFRELRVAVDPVTGRIPERLRYEESIMRWDGEGEPMLAFLQTPAQRCPRIGDTGIVYHAALGSVGSSDNGRGMGLDETGRPFIDAFDSIFSSPGYNADFGPPGSIQCRGYDIDDSGRFAFAIMTADGSALSPPGPDSVVLYRMDQRYSCAAGITPMRQPLDGDLGNFNPLGMKLFALSGDGSRLFILIRDPLDERRRWIYRVDGADSDDSQRVGQPQLILSPESDPTAAAYDDFLVRADALSGAFETDRTGRFIYGRAVRRADGVPVLLGVSADGTTVEELLALPAPALPAGALEADLRFHVD